MDSGGYMFAGEIIGIHLNEKLILLLFNQAILKVISLIIGGTFVVIKILVSYLTKPKELTIL